MRLLLSGALLCLWGMAEAKTYYFSSSSGDDARSAAQAQNPGTPWRSLQKLNAVFASLEPGDEVLLKRGDTFYGTLAPNRSGTASDPITIGAYGSGNKPIVTGFVTLDDWTSIGGGRYETTHPALGGTINMVAFDGEPQAMGRFPNASAPNGGYLNFESHGSNFIKDDELPASPSWKGAELVVRSNRYTIDRTTVTAHSGTQLSYSPALSYKPHNGFGYFLQGDVRTLDLLGEWYHNEAAKKLTVYFDNTAPSSHRVQVSTVSRLLYVFDENYIVVEDLAFEGGNERTVELYSADYVTVKNCDITLSGIEGVMMSNGKGVRLENNNIRHTNNMAVIVSNCDYASVKNNIIQNTGVLNGMGQNGAGKTTAIKETGDYNIIENNNIENTGYIGINFKGNHVTVRNNYINNFNLIKDDGGGIYTQNASPDDDREGQRLIGNIVINGIGAAAGTSSSVAGSTTGIYMDDHADGVEIRDNTVARCSKTGIYIHNATGITLRGNTLYDNRAQLILVHDQGSADEPIRNMVIRGNTFFSKTPSQTVVQFWTVRDDIAQMGTLDSNYYCRPLDDGYVLKVTYMRDGRYVHEDHDLQSWQQTYRKDLASKRTAAQIIPHKVNALMSANRFSNGTFDATVSGINVMSAAESFGKAWNSNKIDRGTFEGKASASKQNPFVISVPVGAVRADRVYLVKFSMQNTEDTRANVFLREAQGNYTILSNTGVKSIVRVGTSRKDYEFAFTPRQSEANTILFFEVYGEDHTVWADNIRVHEADVTLTNADDSLRLAFNAGTSSRSVPLDGSYVDARGRVYDGAITLAPYQSAVLIKKDKNDDNPDDDEVVNKAPVVSLTAPLADQSYEMPESITITASASDADGSIEKVEFYNGTTLLGSDNTSPYSYVWSNVAEGTHTLMAKAFDNGGAATVSEAVSISVYEKDIAETDTVAKAVAPVVKIKTPTNNQTFTAPALIDLSAEASDADGSIAKVEFFNGSKLLKTEYNNPYTFSWKNLPAGTYTITAKATDNEGNTTTSAAVVITVTGSSNPVVSIKTPVNNQTFTGPATIGLSAVASDPNGSIARVQLYNGTTLLKTEYTAPYTFTWKNVAAGTYKLTAKATDNDGNTTVSAVVNITVKAPVAPTVSIKTPVNNQRYSGPAATINMSAMASDADGSIAKVEFFNGSKLLKTEYNNPYTFSWKNVPAGTYKITAKATDNNGNTKVSSAVTVIVEGAQSAVATIALSPNPVQSSTLAITPSGFPNSSTTKITILKTDGTVVKTISVNGSNQRVQLDVSSLKPQSYMIQVASGFMISCRQFQKM